MFKISEKLLKEIYNCIDIAGRGHRALSFDERTENKVQIRKIKEQIEKEYPTVIKK